MVAAKSALGQEHVDTATMEHGKNIGNDIGKILKCTRVFDNVKYTLRFVKAAWYEGEGYGISSTDLRAYMGWRDIAHVKDMLKLKALSPSIILWFTREQWRAHAIARLNTLVKLDTDQVVDLALVKHGKTPKVGEETEGVANNGSADLATAMRQRFLKPVDTNMEHIFH